MVASRKFCCCLPVRFGVVCAALLGLLGGGLIMAAGWSQVHRLTTHDLTLDGKEIASLWVVSLAYTLLTINSIFGLIGAFGRIRGLVKTYAILITFNTVLTIAVGIYFIWTLFHRSQSKIDKCVGGTNGDIGTVKHWVCDKGFDVIRGVLVAILVILWLFQIAGCFISFDYVGQLADEEDADYGKKKQYA